MSNIHPETSSIALLQLPPNSASEHFKNNFDDGPSSNTTFQLATPATGTRPLTDIPTAVTAPPVQPTVGTANPAPTATPAATPTAERISGVIAWVTWCCIQSPRQTVSIIPFTVPDYMWLVACAIGQAGTALALWTGTTGKLPAQATLAFSFVGGVYFVIGGVIFAVTCASCKERLQKVDRTVVGELSAGSLAK